MPFAAILPALSIAALRIASPVAHIRGGESIELVSDVPFESPVHAEVRAFEFLPSIKSVITSRSIFPLHS